MELMMSNLLEAFSGIPRKRGKPYDEKNIDRDLSWIKTIAEEQKKVAERMASLPRNNLIACPICESKDFSPFITIYSFQYSICNKCDHYFIDSLPDQSSIAQLYVGDSELHCCQSIAYNDSTFNKRLDFITRPKVAFVREHISPDTSSVWFDIGCAFGEMLIAARELGWRVKGIEADKSQADEAKKKGLEVLEGYVTPDNAKSFLNEVSVVSAINCIEHIPDPLSLLKSINTGIEVGSYLVIEVPRQPSLGSFANFTFPGYVYRQFCAPDHVHVFSEKSLETLLHRTGFEAVAIWTFGKDAVDFLSQAALNSGKITEAGQKFLDVMLGVGAKQIQSALDSSGLSDTIFLIARKGSSK